jgi:putative tryptophan/tyrosine transport system substrate-binding protein
MGVYKGCQAVLRFRRFMTWVAIWSMLSPQILLAQQSVVVVRSLEAKPYTDAFQGFKETLAAKGFRPILQEYTYPEGRGDGTQILSAIQYHRPSLIVTLGSAATTLMHSRVQDIPIVFCMVLNPVASGFVQSMQSSGNNLTGASLDIPPKLQFETLKAVLPYVKTVGVLYNRLETGKVVEPAARAAAELGLDLIAAPVDAAENLQQALESLQKRIDALWSVADSTVFASDRSIEFLLRQTLQYKIPFMGLSPAFVKAGALLALSVDYPDVGVQCGEQAAIVLSGRAPTSLPVTIPRRVTLYLNLNVARAIGVEIPASTMAEAVILR